MEGEEEGVVFIGRIIVIVNVTEEGMDRKLCDSDLAVLFAASVMLSAERSLIIDSGLLQLTFMDLCGTS